MRESRTNEISVFVDESGSFEPDEESSRFYLKCYSKERVPMGDFALLGIAFNVVRVASIQFQWPITNWELATLATGNISTS